MKTGRFTHPILFLVALGYAGPLARPAPAAEESFLESLDIGIHGFLDARAGIRTQTDPNEEDTSLAETRIQLDLERIYDSVTVRIRSDFLYDNVPSNDDLDLEEGTGPIDLREANLALYALSFMDMKIGRQILTWGTGDLLFINDMFPKDWQSFFSGRDEEYLKAPSDAAFVSIFSEFANLDIAYTPRFDADRYISGDRISYWNPMLGARAGRNAIVDPERPDDWFHDDEIAVRVHRTVSGYELAAYGYSGYWKSPRGVAPEPMRPIFPELSVYGASLRGSIGKGIVNIEAGYYDSEDDSRGADPHLPNSETRGLMGYERELMKDLSMGVQYYVEHMMDYDEYVSTLPEGMNAADEDRQVATVRLTRQAMNQTLTLSLFTYYSPTDEDTYLRPVVKYKATDSLLLTAGGNFFAGNDDHTFFGQFERNNNVYAGARYSF